jgi:hypothetical protein
MTRRETGIGRLASSSATPKGDLPDLQLQTNHCTAANGRDVPKADLTKCDAPRGISRFAGVLNSTEPI